MQLIVFKKNAFDEFTLYKLNYFTRKNGSDHIYYFSIDHPGGN